MAAWRCLEVAQGSNDQLSYFYTLYNPPTLQQRCMETPRDKTVWFVSSQVAMEMHVHLTISGYPRPIDREYFVRISRVSGSSMV